MIHSPQLIFLISQPRSGSTLLQRILASHPAIHTTSEPWIALHPLIALRKRGVSADYCHDLARTATLEFLSTLPAGLETYYEAIGLMLNHMYGTALRSSRKTRFLDKTPRYYAIIPELRRIFPEARFIFLIRNPLAVLSSVFEAWATRSGGHYSLRCDYLHDLLAGPVALAAAIAKPGPHDSVIRYEDLVAAPELQLERLCGSLGLDFDPAMVAYGNGPLAGRRWRYGDQGTVYAERKPIPTRVERWRKILGGSQNAGDVGRSYLQKLGRELIEKLGYDFDILRDGLGPSPNGQKPADFLSSVLLVPFCGETCDCASQLKHFKRPLSKLT